VTTGVIRIEPVLKYTFGTELLSFGEIKGGASYELIMEQIAKVSDPYLQMQLFHMVAEVMRIGFSKMYLLAMVIAVSIIFISMLVRNANKSN
jgi:hypothetical protein